MLILQAIMPLHELGSGHTRIHCSITHCTSKGWAARAVKAGGQVGVGEGGKAGAGEGGQPEVGYTFQ